jgi:hypothetical protein
MMARDLVHGLDAVRWAADVLRWEADPVQARLLRLQAERAMLCCSRQWGKSSTTAVAAAHRAIFHPGELILVVSPSARQSAELLRKMESVLSAAGEKTTGDGDNALSLALRNGSRIVGLPGRESTIRGFSGPGLVIVDEASKVQDEVYYAVRPMLATRSDGALWLLSTPFGRRGFFWKEWEKGGKAWERIRVSGPECPRISREFLAEEKRTQPEWWYRQEYLCEFVDVTDSAFNHQAVLAAVRPEVEALDDEED